MGDLLQQTERFLLFSLFGDLLFCLAPARHPEFISAYFGRNLGQLGCRHKTVPELAGQMVAVVRRWLPDVPIKLIGDGAYSGLTLGLTCAKYNVTLIAPLRPDACLCAPAPVRQPGQNGRPRIKGKRVNANFKLVESV